MPGLEPRRSFRWPFFAASHSRARGSASPISGTDLPSCLIQRNAGQMAVASDRGMLSWQYVLVQTEGVPKKSPPGFTFRLALEKRSTRPSPKVEMVFGGKPFPPPPSSYPYLR